jgi:hypothetical protein
MAHDIENVTDNRLSFVLLLVPSASEGERSNRHDLFLLQSVQIISLVLSVLDDKTGDDGSCVMVIPRYFPCCCSWRSTDEEEVDCDPWVIIVLGGWLGYQSHQRFLNFVWFCANDNTVENTSTAAAFYNSSAF